MSYIWERPNLGNNLYEMAIIKQKAMLEADSRTYILQDKNNLDKLKAELGNMGASLKTNIDESGEKPTITLGWADGHTPTDEETNKVKKIIQDFSLSESGDGSGNAANDGVTAFALKNTGDVDQLEKKLHEVFGDAIQYSISKDSEPYKLTIKRLKPISEETTKKWVQIRDAFLTDIRPDSVKNQEKLNKREAIIAEIIKQYPEDIRLKLSMSLYFLANGRWVDGNQPTEQQKANVKTFTDAFANGSKEQIKTALGTIGDAITDGRIKVDPNSKSLYSVPNIEKQVTGNIQMPSMFDSEPDDSMWNDIVITAFGMPMVNLSHPAVKKVISSEDPEHDCPADLKQVKKAIYGDPRLQKVFGTGGFSRMLDKAFNLLTLGVAGATTDAGKRADRIIKEMKAKGGMSTHRNLLMVPYEDIVDADKDNPDLTIKARPYNRSQKKFLDEMEVPVEMLSQFYSAVDPVASAKIYIEMYSNEDSGVDLLTRGQHDAKNKGEHDKHTLETLADSVYDADEPLFEYVSGSQASPQKPLYEYILCTALAVAAAAAVPQVANLVKGMKGDKRANGVNAKEGGDGSEFAAMKKNYVELLQNEGHPPFYILKPKSANKEVAVVSTASTGQLHGGKVLMVSLKINDNQAACFMTPKEVKQYFAV